MTTGKDAGAASEYRLAFIQRIQAALSFQPDRAIDRSALHQMRRLREDGRDRRGIANEMPPILQHGFRPFFFLAALYAGLAIPAWLVMYFSGISQLGPFSAMEWHIHEMLFGYLGAVIAGFILTAVPNWTGRLPLNGWPLAGLVVLWLFGRIACASVSNGYLAMGMDLAFPVMLAAAVWREVVAGRNWRNAPIAAILTLFALANGAHHLEGFDLVPYGLSVHLALALATMLVALIGGRIVPSFTRNWLVKQVGSPLPASFDRVDKLALLATAVGMGAWVAVPNEPTTGILLVIAGALLAARLLRWRGSRTWREPILFILHVGYGWLALAVTLLGCAILWPALPTGAATHALTAGAFGTMTLAVMTRASLGHTGREITADGWVMAIYAAVNIGAVLRVLAPYAGENYGSMLAAGGAIWSLAFLFFAARYAPIFWGARLRS